VIHPKTLLISRHFYSLESYVWRSIYNLKIDTISTDDIPLDRSFLKLWNGIRHVMPSTDRRLELKENTSMAQNAWQAFVYANGVNWRRPSVQSTTGSRGARISGSNAGYTTFRGSVKSTNYPLHSPVSSSLSLPCFTVCHQVSNALYGPGQHVYRVSQEEWSKLRESVPYVELYRYNPKHLYPKLNGYGDNGKRKVWTSCISA